jgi:glycosyltransferase involved in cell wall biosynthesis
MKIKIVIPVYNEERKLALCVSTLDRFLTAQTAFDYELVVADNGSTDRTLDVARDLQRQYPRLGVVHWDAKGRGRALKHAWMNAQAEVLCYMDVDLATDLASFPSLIEAVTIGKYDLAIDSRLLADSKTTRCVTREGLSRVYNTLVKAAFHTRFTDAQCGFKALTRQAADRLLPLVEDNAWFFDTELLVRAEKLDYRICDVPVRWVENPDSRVNIRTTVRDDLRGILRLRRQLAEAKEKASELKRQKAEI